jgi:hypothetical protein
VLEGAEGHAVAFHPFTSAPPESTDLLPAPRSVTAGALVGVLGWVLLVLVLVLVPVLVLLVLERMIGLSK